MARLHWPLVHGRPSVQIHLTQARSSQLLVRTLLADTGAGSLNAAFELILEDATCMFCGGFPGQPLSLRGAYAGSFLIYDLLVKLPALGFSQNLRVVGVPVPPGFDGIACFGFLNQFTYGNFGNPGQFGLEVP